MISVCWVLILHCELSSQQKADATILNNKISFHYIENCMGGLEREPYMRENNSITIGQLLQKDSLGYSNFRLLITQHREELQKIHG